MQWICNKLKYYSIIIIECMDCVQCTICAGSLQKLDCHPFPQIPMSLKLSECKRWIVWRHEHEEWKLQRQIHWTMNGRLQQSFYVRFFFCSIKRVKKFYSKNHALLHYQHYSCVNKNLHSVSPTFSKSHGKRTVFYFGQNFVWLTKSQILTESLSEKWLHSYMVEIFSDYAVAMKVF